MNWWAVVVALSALAVAAAPVGAQAIDLAPTGQLRVAVVLANTAVATKDPATGELRGVWIDLTRALAQRVGVPVVFVEYATNAARDAATGAWDITTGTDTPEQAAANGRAVAVPYMDVDNTLVVAPASAIRTIADMDRPSVRIGAVGGGASERTLSDLVRQAEVVRVSDDAQLVALLQTGQVEALAGNRANVTVYASQVPGARVLTDRYAAQQHRITLAPGRSAASVALASDVTRQALASGLIRSAIARYGVQGVQPAGAVLPGALPRTGQPSRPLAPPAALLGAGMVAVAAALLVRKRGGHPADAIATPLGTSTADESHWLCWPCLQGRYAGMRPGCAPRKRVYVGVVRRHVLRRAGRRHRGRRA